MESHPSSQAADRYDTSTFMVGRVPGAPALPDDVPLHELWTRSPDAIEARSRARAFYRHIRRHFGHNYAFVCIILDSYKLCAFWYH